MSYIINNSRGNVIAVVPEGTANTTAIPITLVGRGVTSYGTAENENYVFILENFASNTAPVNAMQGQFWYNIDTNIISTYSTSNAWVAMATQTFANTAASNALINPVLTGNAFAPTANIISNSNLIATTSFVRSAINTYSNAGNLIGSTLSSNVVNSSLTSVGVLT